MDTKPNGGNHARLIHHCGSVLPFCEVVHVVNPVEAIGLLRSTKEDPPTERWERVWRALGNVDVSFLHPAGRRKAQDVEVLFSGVLGCADRSCIV